MTTGTVGLLYEIGWELTRELGEQAHWKVEDSDMEVWAGDRYFVVTQPDPDTFIVTEEKDEDISFMKDRRTWRDWTDASHDLLERILGPRP